MSNSVEELNEKISDILSDHKIVKFATHANRKNCIKKVQACIAEFLVNANVEVYQNNRHMADHIVNPNKSGKNTGHTIMTQALSAQGDECLKQSNKGTKTASTIGNG